MPSPQSQLLSHLLRRVVKAPSERERHPTMPLVRLAVEALMSLVRPAPGLAVEARAGALGEWQWPEGAHGEGAVLYFHGGGYLFCSPRTHRSLTASLARRGGLPVFAARYRLAPEHPYPAALEDALEHYQRLVDQGYRVALAGDSAGGGLALATLVALRDRGWPLPAATVCFSPWTDLAGTGPSLDHNHATCVMFSSQAMRRAAAHYVGQACPRSPLVSPLYADLRGLPPILLHVSDSEVLLDDSLRLAERARAEGVPVTLKVWRRQPHAWQLFPYLLPEARASLDEASAFLRTHLSLPEPSAPLAGPYSVP